MRLNKFLSHCGVASRRQADEMILAGRIFVNDQKADRLGMVIDTAKDEVRVDEQIISLPQEESYVLLNKPKGYISSLSDKFERPTVVDLIKAVPARVYPVGRLDLDTEGVLLLTNDGELAYRLAHCKAKLLTANEEASILQLELHEGKKREIRRMMTALGYHVRHLKRTRFADVTCEGMRTGSWRFLNRKEISKLKRKVGLL